MPTRALCGSLTGLLLLGVSSHALAQSQSQPVQPANSGKLEEIVVTARRVTERLQRVPVSVTALTGKDLVARGVTTITGLAEATPNLHITEAAASANAAVLQIRGQVQTDTVPTLDPSVGVYVDDVYFARSDSILFDLLDVHDVEVLKGPQGTLYGRNTIGGAIKVTTQAADPNGAYSGYVNTGFGNYGSVDASGAINLPIVPGKLALRYAASFHEHDGYTDSYLLPTAPFNALPGADVATSLKPIRKIDTDNQDNNSQRVSLRFTPSEDFSIDATASLYRSDNNGSLAVTPKGDVENYTFGDGTPNVYSLSPQRQKNFYAALTNSVPFANTNTDTAEATLRYNMTDWLTSKLILGYVSSHNNSSTNADGSVTPGLAFFQFEPVLNDKQHQVSAEYQLLGKALDEKLSWILGLYYFKENASETQAGGVTAVFDTPDSVNYAGEASAQSESAYGNMTYSWTSKLRTNIGLRLTEDNKGIIGDTRIDSLVNPGYCVYSAGPGVVTSNNNDGPCALVRNDTYRYITFDVGADYQLTPDIFLYGKIGDGYRGGGEQFRAIGPASAVPFEPDRVLNYEVGIKSEWLDHTLRVNLGAYHTDWKNVQQTLIITAENPRSLLPVTGTVIVNQGDAGINGIEGDAVERVTDHLTLYGDFGVNDVEFQDHTIRQQLSPKLVWGASAVYTQPTEYGPLAARVDVSHTGSVYVTQIAEIPDSKLPGYTLMNARLSYRPKPNIEVFLAGKNLTGQHYFNYELISGYSTAFPAFYGARGGYLGAPRTFGGGVNFSF